MLKDTKNFAYFCRIMRKRAIRLTADGSTTLELLGAEEHFHSMHGAIQESEHIYIQNGLAKKAEQQTQIRIFEMGFGTGLNALLSALYAKENNVRIDYVAIEAYPLEKALTDQLNYPNQLALSKEKTDLFSDLHACEWEKRHAISPNFTFEKQASKLEDFVFDFPAFDLVFFDAFNPDLQPELWTEAVFKRMYVALNPGALLLTYSAKGKVKRAMKAAGFVVEGIPGPPGKREITRATKPID